MDKEQLWREFMEFVHYKEQMRKHKEELFESFSNTLNKSDINQQTKPNKSGNSYIDIILLIIFGIIIIFIMDSFVNLGKKSKK